jgi:hypothetical protein
VRLALARGQRGTIMSEQDLFNGLIATYRELNMKVRPLSEERLRLGRRGESVRDVIVDMRNDEMRFSQELKDRLVGVEAGESAPLEVIGPDDTTVEVISQFGTARESTLAMLRGLAPEAWDDQGPGNVTIRGAADALLARDGKHLEKLVRLLGSPTG